MLCLITNDLTLEFVHCYFLISREVLNSQECRTFEMVIELPQRCKII